MFDRIDPTLLPYIGSESRRLLQDGILAVDDHQALLDEATKKRDFIEASIPKPTRDNLIQRVHGEYQDMLKAGRLESRLEKTLLDDAERGWYEGHRAQAIRKAEESGWRDLPKPQPEIPEPPIKEPEQSPKTQDSSSSNRPELEDWWKPIDAINQAARDKGEPRQPKESDTEESSEPISEEEGNQSESAQERTLRKREELLSREERLQKQRASERTQQSLRNWTRQLGFTPLDELPPQGALDRNADTDKPPEAVSQAASVRLRNALELLTQHPKLSAGGGATVFLIAAVSLEFSGGKPWKVGVAAAIGYLLAFLLLVFVFYEAKLFAKHRKGAIAASGVIFLAMATVWYLLLPDEPLTAQQIAAEVWKHAPSPTPLQNPSPVPSIQQSQWPDPSFGVITQDKVIIDRKGVAVPAGKTILYPQIQLEYDYPQYRFVIYVNNTNLTKDVCIRLLDYFPHLKVEMLRGIERSAEYYPELRYEVSKSKLVINYKGSLTKEQIKEIEMHAKQLKIGLILEGPSSP